MDSLRLQEKYQKLSDCFKTVQANVTVCAVKAIDSVMSENDPDWFIAFKTQELAFKDNIAIVRADQSKLSDVDFQALIKIFRFRESKEDLKFAENQDNLITFDAVFERYNLERKVNGRSKFSAMLDDLIVARNEVAHLSAELSEVGYLESDNDEVLKGAIYALRRAIIDYLSFLSYFKGITSSSGVSYYDSASNEFERIERELGFGTYSVSEIIKKYSLNVSEEAFAEYCRKVYIPTHNTQGKYYFESADVEMTVRMVKTGVESRRNKNIILIIALLVAICIIASLITIPFLSDHFEGKDLSGSGSDHSSSDYSSTENSSSKQSDDSSSQKPSKPDPQNSSSSKPGSSKPGSQSSSSSKPGSSKPSPQSSSSSKSSSLQSPALQDTFVDHFTNDSIEGRYEPNEISLVPKEVYWDGDMLVATCFVVNAMGRRVTNANVRYIKITDGKNIIAEGYFSDAQNFTINSMSYTVHTFRFFGSDIENRNASLEHLVFLSRTSYD